MNIREIITISGVQVRLLHVCIRRDDSSSKLVPPSVALGIPTADGKEERKRRGKGPICPVRLEGKEGEVDSHSLGGNNIGEVASVFPVLILEATCPNKISLQIS